MKRRNLNKKGKFNFSNREIEEIPIEDAMKLLKEGGIGVPQKEAEQIMDFLYNYLCFPFCFDISINLCSYILPKKILVGFCIFGCSLQIIDCCF